MVQTNDNENAKPDIEEGERQASVQIEKYLKPYIEGIKLAHAVIDECVGSIPEMKIEDVSSSLKVTVSLLIKIVNDLRSIWIMSARGYSVQAATIASSLYEASYMLAFIADDEELANRWIEHSNPKKLPERIEIFTKEALKKQVDDYETVAKEQYEIYRQLCMAKHGNPLNQKLHGYIIEGDTVIGDFGPEITEQSIRLSCFSMENSINFAMVGLTAFINSHLRGCEISELIKKYNYLSSYYTNLQNYSYEFFGEES